MEVRYARLSLKTAISVHVGLVTLPFMPHSTPMVTSILGIRLYLSVAMEKDSYVRFIFTSMNSEVTATQLNPGKFQKQPVPKIVTDVPSRTTHNYTRKDWMITCYNLV